MRRIAAAAPGAELAPLREQMIAAFARVLESGRYVLGAEVEAFEREWAARCETNHAIGVSSGTDALVLALRAVGVERGDEVLVPAMTATATWAAVAATGAIPVGVDIEAASNGIDAGLAAEALTPRTKAIVAVHLFGRPADLAPLLELARQARVALVEDAAQAHAASWRGRRVGSIGAAAAFSFYPTKNLGAIGDAGAVTTSDAELAAKVRALREYGWNERREAVLAEGLNARLDELQAAILRVALTRLSVDTERRRELAARYGEGLRGVPGVELPRVSEEIVPAWHQYVIRHARRRELASGLAERGVETAVHYRTVPALEPAFAGAPRPRGGYPVSERHAQEALSLPMHAALSDEESEEVIEAVRAVCASLVGDGGPGVDSG